MFIEILLTEQRVTTSKQTSTADCSTASYQWYLCYVCWHITTKANLTILNICKPYTHTYTFSGPLSGTTRVRWYQKDKTNLDFTEARDSEWQWHLLGHMQVCTLLQTDNHASTPALSFLQAGCHFCHPTNSVKALEASYIAKNIRSASKNIKYDMF